MKRSQLALLALFIAATLIACVQGTAPVPPNRNAPAAPGNITPKLLAPATADVLSPMDADRWKTFDRGGGYVKAAYPVYVNRRAFDWDAITVELDGREYRFVGSIQYAGAPPIDYWIGRSSDGGRARLTRSMESVSGFFEIGGRFFGFGGRGEHAIFFERKPGPPPGSEETAERVAEQERQRLVLAKAASKTPTKAEECGRMAESLAEYEGFLRIYQSPKAQLGLEAFLAGTKARQLEIGC